MKSIPSAPNLFVLATAALVLLASAGCEEKTITMPPNSAVKGGATKMGAVPGNTPPPSSAPATQ